MHAHAKCRRFGEEDSREIDRFFGRSKHSQHKTGPILFHLSRGKKYVESAAGKKSVHRSGSELRTQVVQIRLDLGNLIGLGANF